jgi:hypothetical protein
MTIRSFGIRIAPNFVVYFFVVIVYYDSVAGICLLFIKRMNSMQYFIATDIAWDCALGDFLKGLDKHNAKLHHYIAEGPGGGNPCVTLQFNKKEDIVDWFKGIYKDDDASIAHYMTRVNEVGLA